MVHTILIWINITHFLYHSCIYSKEFTLFDIGRTQIFKEDFSNKNTSNQSYIYIYHAKVLISK